MKTRRFRHEFVDYLPTQLEDGILYVSMEFRTVAHRCPCGCGREIVTSLGPTDWKLTFDGEAVSLSPSVGNWNLPCQSHYWIDNGRVVDAELWSAERIVAGRERDRRVKQQYFKGERPGVAIAVEDEREIDEVPRRGLLERIRNWWSS